MIKHNWKGTTPTEIHQYMVNTKSRECSPSVWSWHINATLKHWVSIFKHGMSNFDIKDEARCYHKKLKFILQYVIRLLNWDAWSVYYLTTIFHDSVKSKVKVIINGGNWPCPCLILNILPATLELTHPVFDWDVKEVRKYSPYCGGFLMVSCLSCEDVW